MNILNIEHVVCPITKNTITYTQAVLRTVNPQESKLADIHHALLGIRTEVDELLNATILNKYEYNNVNIVEELGDITWYAAFGAYLLNSKEVQPSEFLISELDYTNPTFDSVNDAVTQLHVLSTKLTNQLKRKLIYKKDEIYLQSDVIQVFKIACWIAECYTTSTEMLQLNVDKLAKRYVTTWTAEECNSRNIDAELALFWKVR